MGYGDRSGFGAVKETIQKAASGGGYTKAGHPIEVMGGIFWKKDGERKTVRFLTDNVISFPMHGFVPTKDGKNKDFACTAELEGDLKRPCWICENMTRTVDGKVLPMKPTTKVIGAVIERNPDGSDVMKEYDLLVDPDDKEGPSEKTEGPTFSILSQGATFWTKMDGYYSKYKGTTMNRDYEIVRVGTGLKTTYNIMPEDADPEYTSPESLWDLYGIPYKEGEDPVQEQIIKWIERKGTVEYFERYLRMDGSSDEPEQDEPEDEKPAPTRGFAKKAPGSGGGIAGLKDKLAQYGEAK